MLTHERPSAERTPRKPTRLLMLGGTLLRHTSVDIPIVSAPLMSWSSRRLNSYAVAIAALSNTVTFLTQAGRFRQAADREKEIAQIWIQEKQDLVKGCKSYERAGEWYAQEDATACVSIRIILRPCPLNIPLAEPQMLVSRTLLISMPKSETTLTRSLVMTRWQMDRWDPT